jgi:phosphatidylglycerophosphatase A
MSKSQSDNLSVLDIFRRSGFTKKTALALSTWFGTGLLPVAPGTFGTIATAPLILGLNILGIWYSVLALVSITAIAVWVSDVSQDLLDRKDPPEVVIDEVSGFLVTMFLLPHTWLALAMGFVLFRFFDIFKPYPVKKVEKFRGGFGIVMDDLLAGFYANLCVRMILFLLDRT